MYDLVTLGETMLRFTPPDLKRLEQTTSFNLEIGGSESNLAIGLARLGLKVLWLSRLTHNPLGRFIEGAIARHGVDTTRIIWTESDRVGLYFLEEGPPPRQNTVIYDRKQSAMSQLRASELPVDLFLPNRARLLHLTGITPALSPTTAVAAQRALNLAKEAGWQVSFDFNYRRLLWSPAEALAGCQPFLEAADLIFAPLNDVRLLYGLDPSVTPEQILALLRGHYPQATLVVTLGKEGAIGGEPGGPVVRQAAFPTEMVDPLGGGDAFAAGFLYQYLTGEASAGRMSKALLWGAAMAALKYTIPTDIPWLSQAEVESLVQRGMGEAKVVR
ncbi:MAG: sugar kinase [Anaerolineales bacterium]|nr:sugar kinase [Anaerolineales bacterium]